MSLSSISIAVVPLSIDDHRFEGVAILIDGVDLISQLRSFEKPFAAAEGNLTMAGQYSYLTIEEAARALLPASTELDEDGRVAVLDCECGNPGCWPFMVRITVREDAVVWSDFAQLHRADDPLWNYGEL